MPGLSPERMVTSELLFLGSHALGVINEPKAHFENK